MTNIISEESYAQLETNNEERDLSNALKTLNKIPKFKLGKNTHLFFDENMKYISLCPILPLSKIDLLFQLYDINLTRIDLINKIKQMIGEENLKKEKTCDKNGIQIRKINGQIQIIDEHFINDCLILSEKNEDGHNAIGNKISKAIFGGTITYNYKTNDENKKRSCVAYLKYKDDIFIESDLFDTDKEAKLNANKKIILKYLPEQKAQEIINNIDECLIREEKAKKEKKERYDKLVEECGGDRKLLRKKRKITNEEFSRRLPYFNMLHKDKSTKNNSESILNEDDDDEDYFMNTEELPINELLLGDLGIVEHHLKDFKYTPLKIYEMIRDSEKMRGVDFNLENSQINNKNYCHNNEVTIFSQKLGIKADGYGKSKEEAENKCALKLLKILFEKKFRTYCELHEYFIKKKGKYLDIILKEENGDEDNKVNEQNNLNNDEKKGDDNNNDEVQNIESNKNTKKKLDENKSMNNSFEENNSSKKKKLDNENKSMNNSFEESNSIKKTEKSSKKSQKNMSILNSEKDNNENEKTYDIIDIENPTINKSINNNIENDNDNNIHIEYIKDENITNDENSIKREMNIESTENINENNSISLTDSQYSIDNYINNVNNNKNMKDSQNKNGNYTFNNNSNNNSYSNGISVINNSFSSNNSMTGNKIIEELSKTKKHKKYNNDNYSNSNDSKKREEMFDESMFFI